MDDEVSDIKTKHEMSIIGICKNLDITRFGINPVDFEISRI